VPKRDRGGAKTFAKGGGCAASKKTKLKLWLGRASMFGVRIDAPLYSRGGSIRGRGTFKSHGKSVFKGERKKEEADEYGDFGDQFHTDDKKKLGNFLT